MNKNQSRLKRSRQTRIRIGLQQVKRLSLFRSNMHIYATLYDESGARVLVSASTTEKDLRLSLPGSSGGNIKAAALVGTRIAEKALALGIDRVAFDRSGYAYHGRVRALADAARAAGLKF